MSQDLPTCASTAYEVLFDLNLILDSRIPNQSWIIFFQIRISSKICFKPALPSILNSLQLSQIHTGNHPDSSVYYPDTQIHTATSSSSHSDMKDHNRNKVGSNKNWLTYNHTRNIQHTPQSMRERNHTVSSYYNQTAIDDKARQNSIRLTPATIMYTGMCI